MTENVELTAPVIDALTNLNIDTKMINEVCLCALSVCLSVRLSVCPSVCLEMMNCSPNTKMQCKNNCKENLKVVKKPGQ